MVQAYWEVGRIIVEEEQKGAERAEYGKALIKELSRRLTRDYGRGFTERNLWYMRDFYLTFSKVNALRSELTWTHYRLLLRVGKEEARNFYMLESVKNNWSTRELERQINSLLFERLALSEDKSKVLELSTKGQVIQEPNDIIKDPYVLEFLDLKENGNYLEKDLERTLISKLQAFLLELGKVFSFVARQRRITVDGDHYYIDHVFTDKTIVVYRYRHIFGKTFKIESFLKSKRFVIHSENRGCMEQIKHKGGVRSRKLVLEFPEEISEKDLEDEEVQQKSKEGAVFELLRKKKISQGKAAELLGITRDELFDLMAKLEIPVIDMSKEELKKELAKNIWK